MPWRTVSICLLAGCLTRTASAVVLVKQDAFITAPTPEFASQFGTAVSKAGSLLAVGEPNLVNSNGVPIGTTFVYEKNPLSGTWQSIAELRNPDSNLLESLFGSAVSLSGNRVLVGAFGMEGGVVNGRIARNVGAAYLYERNPSTSQWSNVAKFRAPDGLAEDLFGAGVALQDNLALVSSGHKLSASAGKGAVYIYQQDPASHQWNAAGNLPIQLSDARNSIGLDIALSGDLALVKTNEFNAAANTTFGVVHVYHHNSSLGWDDVARLAPPPGQQSLSFGNALALDHNIAVIGANPTGTTYVFEANPQNAAQWTLTGQLTNFNSGFGQEVTVNAGNVVVAAPYDTLSGGLAFLYQKDPIGAWNLTTQFSALVNNDAQLGTSLTLDGTTLVAGAPYTRLGNVVGAGTAAVFTVPEPNSILLAAIALCLLISRRAIA